MQNLSRWMSRSFFFRKFWKSFKSLEVLKQQNDRQNNRTKYRIIYYTQTDRPDSSTLNFAQLWFLGKSCNCMWDYCVFILMKKIKQKHDTLRNISIHVPLKHKPDIETLKRSFGVFFPTGRYEKQPQKVRISVSFDIDHLIMETTFENAASSIRAGTHWERKPRRAYRTTSHGKYTYTAASKSKERKKHHLKIIPC